MLATIWAAILAVLKAIAPSLSTTWLMSGIKAVITDVGKLPKWLQALIVLVIAFLAVKIAAKVGIVLLGSLVVDVALTFLAAVGIYRLEQDYLTSVATK